MRSFPPGLPTLAGVRLSQLLQQLAQTAQFITSARVGGVRSIQQGLHLRLATRVHLTGTVTAQAAGPSSPKIGILIACEIPRQMLQVGKDIALANAQ